MRKVWYKENLCTFLSHFCCEPKINLLKNSLFYYKVYLCVEVWSLAMCCNMKHWFPRPGCPQDEKIYM